jgi:hypothetical protein
MKTQQITISEVRLVYRTKVKASERLQVKCSKDAFDSAKLQMDGKMHVIWNNSSDKEVTEIPFHFQLDNAKSLIKHIIVNNQ